MKQLIVALGLSLVLAAGTAGAGETASPPGAKVYFDGLSDGDRVTSPVAVKFGVEGMDIVPAGTDMENSGHHHLFVDRPVLGEGPDGADELDANILSDEQHLHFGKGQTETSLELAPGEHTLQLVLGDKDHIPHHPPVVSERITITVE
ncbi:uncharacterized protein DUF4399 [Hoeflea halophila]|uniref:Uncharacterized protein DUF4399 n=1 Tax=Hoeflea halophila TaxID=714899 RepID=A0A286HWW7_9HYPH|nr:DUF4399 domain-containing protein [Hoeflea halophila]SOE11986.1 uncharacterized protein DUF4399 [Hoeflea halophila]